MAQIKVVTFRKCVKVESIQIKITVNIPSVSRQ